MPLNQLQIIGNVGNDPEMRYTPSGAAVTTFSVATSYKRSGGDEVTTWFRVSAWDKLAEIVNQYLHKGYEVFVQGRVGLHQYVRQDGTPGASIEVTADRVVLLRNAELRGQQQTYAGQPGGYQQRAPAPVPAASVDNLPAAPAPVGYGGDPFGDAPLSPDDLPF